jgi:hypothetical protein
MVEAAAEINFHAAFLMLNFKKKSCKNILAINRSATGTLKTDQ